MVVKIDPNLMSSLSSAIRKAGDKLDKAEASKTESRIAEAQIQGAENRISSAEAQVTRHEIAKKEAQDKLSPPPTKQVQGDGKKGGTKTVVDEREKDKLQAQVRAAEVQVQQAQSAVEAAKEQAQEFKNEALQTAGISQEQISEMINLSSLISQLQSEANDPQTDLAGDDFQDSLRNVIDKTDELSKDLPNTPNAGLSDFWDEIHTGLSGIQSTLTDASTPTPAEIDRSNNFENFFVDVDQGFDTILSHMEREGFDTADISQIRNSRDLIVNEQNNYLGGVNRTSDMTAMSEFMTNMNVLIDQINDGDGVSAEDLAQLSVGAEEVGEILATGGSNFNEVVEVQFNTISNNISELSEQIGFGDPGFAQLVGRTIGIINNQNNGVEDLQGLTLDEMNQIVAYNDLVRDAKDTALGGGALADQTLQDVVTQGNQLLDLLVNKYGLVENSGAGNSPAPITGGNGNGNGGGNNPIFPGIPVGGGSVPGILGGRVPGRR